MTQIDFQVTWSNVKVGQTAGFCANGVCLISFESFAVDLPFLISAVDGTREYMFLIDFLGLLSKAKLLVFI